MTELATATPNEPSPFELLGELPRGTLVLEASAGTGKTFAIAALATRYVAEDGIPLSELLLVTFTKAATAELRDRVRRRLVDAADHLTSVLAGHTEPSGDALLDHLAATTPADQRRRQQRLMTAVTEFDTATISTIHGFCQQVLRGIGLTADVPAELRLLEDEELLREQVVRDRMVTHFVARPGAPTLSSVLAAAKAAVDDPEATILPQEEPDPDDVAGDDPEATGRLTAEIAREVRLEVGRRKRAAGLLSHNDLLARLRDTLRDPVHGDAAVEVLRDRYRVALIDEFQDTDPVQWEILERAFATPSTGRALILIGDPKQAIYAFRGADVRAYLRATRQATRATLATNWRSDAPLVDALNQLFAGTVYGTEEIVHRDVAPAPAHDGSRLTGPRALTAPLALRCVTELAGGTAISSDGARRLVPDDVAAEILQTLADGGVHIDGEPARPRDLAVLVRANQDAAIMQQALRRVGVPAVINGVGSVFATAAAREWLQLLDTLDVPSSERAARQLAVTAFGGWTATELATADDAAWDAFHERLHGWAAVFAERGVAALLRTVGAGSGLAARLLASTEGERHLTDIHHVAELLHAAQLKGDLGPAALAGWLRERTAGIQESGVPSDEQARRLESDAEAVQILTVHRSKGLEFGIVFCPYLWSPGRGAAAPLTVHGPDGEARIIDVGPKERSGFADAREQWTAERRAEDLRLLYVAATRARHRVVLWWVPTKTSHQSSLATVLFSRDGAGRVETTGRAQLPATADTPGVLAELAASIGGSSDRVPPNHDPAPLRVIRQGGDRLRSESLDRWIDHRWRRTSYSGLTRADRFDTSREPDAAAEVATKDDEELEPSPTTPTSEAPRFADDGRDLRSIPLPLAEVRGSAELGTMLHEVLENADFGASDLRSELAHHLDEQQAKHLVAGEHRDVLLAGLVAAVTTPLGPLAEDRPLTAFPRSHRLDEPRFELPLAGGDRAEERTPAALARIADLVEHHLADDDPVAGYHERLRDPRFRVDIQGYLNGAIDLLLRVESDTGADRYLVVDHKTNRLGWPDTPTAWHYRPEGLATAMQDGHYPLQALIYAVATHRLLRWRVADYDPAVHLGGVAYLFLRGMTGPDVPRIGGHPCGVFTWQPPAALVTDLSALLDGRGIVGRARP